MKNHKWVLERTVSNNVAAERIEQRVFEARFGYHQQLWEEEYRPYDTQTIWITLSHRGIMVGAIRALVGKPETLKFSHDLSRFWSCQWSTAAEMVNLDSNVSPIEGATLSVLPEYRNYDRGWPVKALCAAFGHFVIDSGASHSVYMLDPKVHKLLTIALGLPFIAFPEFKPFNFHGLLIPVYSRVSDHLKVIKTSDDDFFALYCRRDETVKGGTKLPTVCTLATDDSINTARILSD